MSGKRVLIIDDEKNMRHMLQVMLEKEGYVTEAAEDGVKALTIMESSDLRYIQGVSKSRTFLILIIGCLIGLIIGALASFLITLAMVTG